MNTYKVIKRNYCDDAKLDNQKQGYFIAQGEWADGHLAYSRLDENKKIIDDEQGAYAQIRYLNKLIMIRI